LAPLLPPVLWALQTIIVKHAFEISGTMLKKNNDNNVGYLVNFILGVQPAVWYYF
jgi:hypothetical protein